MDSHEQAWLQFIWTLVPNLIGKEKLHASEVLAALDERQKKALALRHGIGYPRKHLWREVGAEIGGVTESRAAQIADRAKRKLRSQAFQLVRMEGARIETQWFQLILSLSPQVPQGKAFTEHMVAAARSIVSELGRKVLAMRHGIGYPKKHEWPEIGAALGFSEDDVIRMAKKAERSLRAGASHAAHKERI